MSDYTSDTPPVDEAGTAGNPTDENGPEGSVATSDAPSAAPSMQGQVSDGAAPTTVPVSPQGQTWKLVAEGDYAGDEGGMIDALRGVLAGYGTTSAVFTTSWGDDFDVSNPNV